MIIINQSRVQSKCTIAHLILSKLCLQGTPAPVGSVWPKPCLEYPTSEYFAVDTNNFRILLTDRNGYPIRCDVLAWAVDHYTQHIRNLKPENGSIDIGISILEIRIGVCPTNSKNPEPDMHEFSKDNTIRC